MSGVRYRLSRLGFPPRRAMPTARATNERDSEMASLTATLGAMGSPATRTRSRRIAARDAAARVPVPRSQKGDASAPRLRKRQGGALAARASAGGNAPKAAAADVDDSEPAAFGGEFSGDRIKRLQTKTLAALFMSYLSIYFVRKPFSVVKAPMQDALNLSTGAIAGIDSAFLGLYAIGQLTLPSLGDRLGARKMLVTGYLLAAASCFGFAVTSYPAFLAAAWGLNGVAQSLAYPLHVKLLNPWFAPNQRGTAMGLWATSQQVGGVLSTALAAFLLGVAGWRFAVVAPAAFVVVSAAMLMFVPVDPPWCKLEAKPDGGEGVVGECDWRPPIGMAEVLRIPKLGMLMASYFFVKIVRYCLIFWLPFYLARECGMAVATAGYMSCLFDLGGVAGGIATGVICDKYFPGRRTVLGAWMCAALALAILSYQHASQMGVVANGAVMTLVGFLVAGPDALLGSSSIADTCEAAGYGSEVMGTASGLVNGAGSVGAVLQGALTAYVANTYGWGALFGTLAAMSVLAVVTMILSVPKSSRAALKIATA